MTPTSIVAYLVLFAVVGFLFLFVALLLGRFLRANDPTPEKMEPYECGEPPVGSSFVRFDLRFYVIALVFLVLDVEIAFFFPWAVVYGKATRLTDPELPRAVATATYEELGVSQENLSSLPLSSGDERNPEEGNPWVEDAVTLARASLADMIVFFSVLLVGFAYVWKRGDLDWVRADAPRPPDIATSERTPLGSN